MLAFCRLSARLSTAEDIVAEDKCWRNKTCESNSGSVEAALGI